MAQLNQDYLIYAAHGACWTAFGVTQSLRGTGAAATAAPAPAPAPAPAVTQATAPFSRALLAFHSLAFAVMYFGIGNAVIPNRVPVWFAGQRAVGTAIVFAGAALMCWALVWFRSWRFRAQLDAGHELATGGPFAIVRHPIYEGLNLLAIGTAIWIPTTLTWVAVALMVVGSDLRGRAEERVLEKTFGQRYRDYCSRTRRFIPGIY